MPTNKEIVRELKKTWNHSEISVSYKRVIVNPTIITNASDSVKVFRSLWDKELIHLQEQIWALFLSSNKQLIGYRLIGLGNVSGCVVDIKMIVSIALHTMASSVIIAHNHPGGNTRASGRDTELTKRMDAALLLIDVQLLDHIIICQDEHISLKQEGLF